MDENDEPIKSDTRSKAENLNTFHHSLQDLTYGSSIDISAIKGNNSAANTEDQLVTQVPDGGYGWVIVFTAFCNFCLVGGNFMGFSLLYPHMTEGLDSNYGTTGWVGSTSQAFMHMPGFLYAAIVGEIGCRMTCVLGALLTSLGYGLSCFSPNVYTLYITYGIITGSGMGMVYLSNIVIVQRYFDKKRGVATGIAMAGLSCGGITHAALLQHAISKYNWRGALLILSAVNLHGVVCGALQRAPPTIKNESHRPAIVGCSSPKQLSKEHLTEASDKRGINKNHTTELNKPLLQVSITEKNTQDELAALGQGHDLELNSSVRKGYNARLSVCEQNDSNISKTKKTTHWVADLLDFSLLKNPQFVIYGITSMLMNIGMLCFYMHTPSRALHHGIPYQLVVTLPPSIACCTLTSRVIFGCVSDLSCVNRTLQYALGIICGSLVEITFVFSTTYASILIHCLIFGLCNGVFLSVQSTVLVDLLTVQKIAKSQALLGIFIGISCLFVTPFAGFLYDVTQNYEIPYLVTGSVQLCGGLLLLGMFLVLRFKHH